jgi:hypothetical protein
MKIDHQVKRDLISKCTPFTMTNPKRMEFLIKAIEEIKSRELTSSFVEAGVYKGGSSMLAAYTLKELGMSNPVVLLDTFKGMTKPTEEDVKINKGHTYFEKWKSLNNGSYVDWCFGSLNEVKNNMGITGYENVSYIIGDVCKTLPKEINKDMSNGISILRLDTDFYESTKSLMNNLFPLVEEGGFIIFDDYNCWEGAKKAVDEYFDKNGFNKKDIVEVDHSCCFYEVKMKGEKYEV